MTGKLKIAELQVPEQRDLAWNVADLVYSEVHREELNTGKFAGYLKRVQDNVVIVALNHEDEVVGTGAFFSFGLGTFTKEAYVHDVATLPRYRERGVGRLVMGGLEAKAQEMGADSTMLAPLGRSIGFYERLGYDIAADPDCSGVRMTKQLG